MSLAMSSTARIRHWQDNTLVTILTVDGEPFRARARACEERARRAGFKRIRMHMGVDAKTAFPERRPTKLELSRLIIDEHKLALQALQNDGLINTAPFHLVLEDDCTFVRSEVLRERTQRALETAYRTTPEWKLLNLGFVSLTPFLPQRGPLVTVPAPWGAHATLFRATTIPSILKLPWNRGEVVEGWSALQPHLRLCVFPPVAFQEMMPRESPLKGDFQRTTNAWHIGMNLLPYMLVFLGLVIVTVWIARRNPTGFV